MEFLSKDPAKQLVEVKEKLTQRLVQMRNEYEYEERMAFRGHVSCVRRATVYLEIQFLSDILDQMERS